MLRDRPRTPPSLPLRLAACVAVMSACAPSIGVIPADARTDVRSDARTDAARDVAADLTVDAVDLDRPAFDIQPLDTPAADVAPDAAPDVTAPVDTAGPPDTGIPRCGGGIDTDGDGLSNAEECALGTDPFDPDSDDDEVLDGQEVGYPHGCLSPTAAAQRRPPPVCGADTDCRAGERCVGLDPRARDTDGDGVDDGLEDRNLDGVIDTAHGETDPRLADSDGDGRGDGMGGLEICRPTGLATVTQLGLPGAEVQVGFDPRWSAARRAPGTMMRSGVMLEDPATNIAGAAFNLPTVGDVRAEATRVEAIVSMGLGAGASPVIVGRAFTTHEMDEAVTSTYRLARATSATALRDAIAAPMLNGPVAPAPAVVGVSTEFLIDVTTVRRTMDPLGRNTTNVMVTVAPRGEYENPLRDTVIRSGDLVNATSMAPIDRGLGANCQVFRATRTAMADFVWTVDTSGSMGPYQMRLGNTAVQFFNRLRAAGVDFRVGVFNAGSAAPNLETPGFRWIDGTDPAGATRLCEEVTSSTLGRCPASTTDTLSPYAMPGDSETPTGAAVVLHDLFRRRGAMGETNLNRRFREGAQIVTFHVTDEPGANDSQRFFRTRSDPQTGLPWGTTYAAALPQVIEYFRRNSILTFGLVSNNGGSGALAAGASPVACSTLRENDMPRCVIEGNRGAYIPIATATDAEVSSAMMRIVEAVAGAASPFVLERTPITSTIKVRVRGRDVPRSRASGFDYDGASRSIVIYGDAYRPNMGDEVVVSYRLWQPCPTSGAVCTTDSDCCAPNTCRERRCAPPCRPLGAMCAADGDCCAPNACIAGVCAARPVCVPTGAVCTSDANCCAPNACVAGNCAPRPMCAAMGATCASSAECCPPHSCIAGLCGVCRDVDATCTTSADCCGGSPCTGGHCACRPVSGRCTTPRDCCSRYCVDGLCGPG